jgi:PAS domain S-box-containing protein
MPSTLDLAARLSAIVAAHQEILGQVPDVDRVMKIAVRHTQQITDADGAAIEEVEGDELVYRAVSGRAVAEAGLRLKRAGSLSGVAYDTQQSVRSDDVETDDRADRASCKRLGIRSMIVAPLVHHARPFGVLKAFSERPNFFDDLDTYSVELLAGQISVVMMLSQELQQRKASEERYRMLFEQNIAGVFRSTRDGRILDCNEAFAGCLGYESRAEVLARPTWDLYPKRSDREELLSALDRNRAMTNIHLPLKKKDGTAITGIVNVSLIPADDGDTHLLGTLVCA